MLHPILTLVDGAVPQTPGLWTDITCWVSHKLEAPPAILPYVWMNLLSFWRPIHSRNGWHCMGCQLAVHQLSCRSPGECLTFMSSNHILTANLAYLSYVVPSICWTFGLCISLILSIFIYLIWIYFCIMVFTGLTTILPHNSYVHCLDVGKNHWLYLSRTKTHHLMSLNSSDTSPEHTQPSAKLWLTVQCTNIDSPLSVGQLWTVLHTINNANKTPDRSASHVRCTLIAVGH